MASSSIASRKVALWQSVLLASYILALRSTVALADPYFSFPLLPPPGNELEGTFTGQGVQLYQCTQDTASGNLTWKHTGAQATLTLKDDTYTLTHYFQSQPDALGGKPTFASTGNFDKSDDSIVTGLVLHSDPDADPSSNIDSQLLVATSHSGPGALGYTSYIQRLHSRGGVAPAASTCTVPNLTQSVPYNATYVFYIQNLVKPPTAHLPASLAVPADYKPLWSWYATGNITYKSNGSSWQEVDDEADLSYLPGSLVVGSLSLDVGAYSWSTYLPPSIEDLQGTVIASAHVWPGALDWLLLRVNSKVGSGNATIGYAHRVSTRGGLPPSEHTVDTVDVPYSAIFWFYGWW